MATFDKFQEQILLFLTRFYEYFININVNVIQELIKYLM